MSPRAAWRLERLGCQAVHDYAAGKVDWMAAGLPTLRADSSDRRALDAAERHPPTCRPDDLLRDLVITGDATGVVVVNEHGIVLGRVRPTSETGATARVEDVMEPGPTTVRAHEPLGPLQERMRRRDVAEILVTTPEGHLLGVLHQNG